MEYIKLVLVLKEVTEGFAIKNKKVGGIARIETDGGVPCFFLSVINAEYNDGGEFFAYILDGKRKLYSLCLGKRPTSINKTLENADFSSGFACGIVYLKDNLPTLVAYSQSENFNCDLSNFKKQVASELIRRKTVEEQKLMQQQQLQKEKEEQERKTTLDNAPTQEVSKATPEQGSHAEFLEEIMAKYDDEAVATENYFDIDQDIEEKLIRLKEKEDYVSQNENGNPSRIGKEDQEQISESAFCEQFKKSDNNGAKYDENSPYYDAARSELDQLFNKFPEDDRLKKYFPTSQWIRVNYSADKYYVVGLISENNLAKYICYGVPAPYSNTPPKELDGFCSFIPLSIFDMQGDGFWMMFQDAVTGECIKKPTM